MGAEGRRGLTSAKQRAAGCILTGAAQDAAAMPAARVQHWHNLMSTSNPRSFSEELLPAQLPTCRISWDHFIPGAGLVHPEIHEFLVGPPFLLIEAPSSGQELHLPAWCQPCLYPPPHRALSHASFNQLRAQGDGQEGFLSRILGRPSRLRGRLCARINIYCICGGEK